MKFLFIFLWLLGAILVFGLLYLTIFAFGFALQPLWFKIYLIFINSCTIGTLGIISFTIFNKGLI